MKRGDELDFIDYLIGVHQGDSLVFVLFSLVIQAAIHTFDMVSVDKCTGTELKFFPDQHNDNLAGRLTGQCLVKGTPFSFWRSIYVDDGAFIFSSWKDVAIISNFLHFRLECFELKMHIGAEGSK